MHEQPRELPWVDRVRGPKKQGKFSTAHVVLPSTINLANVLKTMELKRSGPGPNPVHLATIFALGACTARVSANPDTRLRLFGFPRGMTRHSLHDALVQAGVQGIVGLWLDFSAKWKQYQRSAVICFESRAVCNAWMDKSVQGRHGEPAEKWRAWFKHYHARRVCYYCGQQGHLQRENRCITSSGRSPLPISTPRSSRRTTRASAPLAPAPRVAALPAAASLTNSPAQGAPALAPIMTNAGGAKTLEMPPPPEVVELSDELPWNVPGPFPFCFSDFLVCLLMLILIYSLFW